MTTKPTQTRVDPAPATDSGPDPIQVLLVEDDSVDARAIIRETQARSDFPTEIIHVQTFKDAVAAIRREPLRFDVILLDLQLPDSTGLDTLVNIRTAMHQDEIPIVILTGLMSKEVFQDSVAMGAQDVLSKAELDGVRLRRTLTYAVHRHDALRRLREQHHEMLLSSTGFRDLIERNLDGLVIVDEDGIVRYANPASERAFGTTADQLMGHPLGIIAHDRTDLELRRADGTMIEVEVRVADTVWQGKPAQLLSLREFTDRKRAEEQSRLLRGLAIDVGTAGSVDEAIERIVLRLSNTLSFPIGRAWRRDSDDNAVLVTTQVATAATALRSMNGGEIVPPPVTITPSAHLFDRAGLEWVHSFGIGDARHDGLADAGFVSALEISIPSCVHGGLVLEFLDPAPRPEDPRHIDMLHAVVPQTEALLRHREVEDALRTSDERYRVLADTAMDAIISTDHDGRVLFANAAAHELLDMAPRDMEGRAIAEMIDLTPLTGSSRHAEAGPIGPKVGDDGAIHDDRRDLAEATETYAFKGDGSRIPIEATAASWTDGTNTNWTWVIRDARERKAVETTLRRRNEDLESFAYAVTHDLRTPLVTLDWLAEQAQEVLDDTKATLTASSDVDLGELDDLIPRIHAQVGRAHEMFGDLHALLRLRNEPDQDTWFSAERVVREVIATHEEMIEQKRATVEVRIKDLGEIRGDIVRLRLALDNVLSNALKYGRPSGGLITIGAERRDDPDADHPWALWVADDGPGIPAEERPHVFQLFYRAPAAERANVEGTGIGLALVERAAWAFDATVAAEDVPAGTRIAIRFPEDRGRPRAIDAASDSDTRVEPDDDA